MFSAPIVTIHDLGQARAVLAVRADAVLLSAEGAGLAMGALWWRALMAAAGAERDVLDCADGAGAAMAALRVGLKAVVLDRDVSAWGAVAGAAGSCGAIVLPCRPVSLDLAEPGAERRLRDWLQRDFNPGLG